MTNQPAGETNRANQPRVEAIFDKIDANGDGIASGQE